MVAMFYFSVVMVSQKDSCGHLKFSPTNKFVFVAPPVCWCQTGTQIDSTPKWDCDESGKAWSYFTIAP